MSGEGEGRVFEIERRVRGHRPVPDGFRKTRVYQAIRDVYFGLDPVKRVRYGEIIFEYKDGEEIKYPSDEPKKVGKVTGKKDVSGEVAESETIVGDPKLMAHLWGDYEILVVTGSRVAYSDERQRITMTHDCVDRLGQFTEFEIMAEQDDDERARASEEIDKFVAGLGIEKSEYVLPYHLQIVQLEMLYEIYRTPITKKELTVPRMASHYHCSVRVTRRLCKELEKLGYVIETKEGFWEPPEEMKVPAGGYLKPAMPGLPQEAGINPDIEAIVAGEMPLSPASRPGKLDQKGTIPKSGTPPMPGPSSKKPQKSRY